MKNPVFFANKNKPQIINIYQYIMIIHIYNYENNPMKIETTSTQPAKRNLYYYYSNKLPENNNKFEKTLFRSFLQNYQNHSDFNICLTFLNPDLIHFFIFLFNFLVAAFTDLGLGKISLLFK